MAGSEEGGKKAAATNKQRYGKNFFPEIGRKGGKIASARAKELGLKRGFAAMSPEQVSAAGKKGGTASRRGK